MKVFLKFALQVPLLTLVIAGAESSFPNLNPVGVFGLAFLLILAYSTGEDIGKD